MFWISAWYVDYTASINFDTKWQLVIAGDIGGQHLTFGNTKWQPDGSFFPSLKHRVTAVETLTAGYCGWYLMSADDSLWQLVSADDSWIVLVIPCDSLWQLVTACDSWWQLVTADDSLWQLVTADDSLWQPVSADDSLWQLVTAGGNDCVRGDIFPPPPPTILFILIEHCSGSPAVWYMDNSSSRTAHYHQPTLLHTRVTVYRL